MEIEKGELFGLLGPNGAGKTTLISILSTILSASSGKAFVFGHDVGSEQDAVRKRIGIVFQDPSLDDELTGEENLDFHGRLYGMNRSVRRERVDEVMSLVDLDDRRRDIVKTYSGGMRRRLEIARGLMHMPCVLFLDEPTLGLDPQTRRKIWTYIKELKVTYGMTIILTTHYMDEADRLCSRVAIIDNGEIVALDSPTSLKRELGGDVLQLEIPVGIDVLMNKVQTIDEINRIKSENQTLSLHVADGESFLPTVFKLAQEVDVAVTSVSMRKPNLEDVFIKHTGREIRDESVTEAKERIRLFMRRKSK